jgi:hypothetical protein
LVEHHLAKVDVESSSLFARSIYEKTPGGDTWGLSASKCDTRMKMREIPIWRILDWLRLGKAICDPMMRESVCGLQIRA